jgi:hypothetical protein
MIVMTVTSQWTSAQRFKRSCACATAAVLASTVAVLIVGFFANQATYPISGAIDFSINLMGMPLAPGRLLLRGGFEKLRPEQFLGSAVLIPLISVVIGTALIFGFWEFFP